MKRLYILLGTAIVLLGALVLGRPYTNPIINPVVRLVFGGESVADRLHDFGETARVRMRPGFQGAGVAYPPQAVTLVAIKAERSLQVYAGPAPDNLKRVLTYPVLGQSGELGPKLREGDRQVPEGLYRIEGLNPNSSFHVSLRVNYPNAFDREKAAKEGRDQPGSDIYIHGHAASVGCLAMGNPAAEDLFTLAADVGIDNLQLIIAPTDFRRDGVGEPPPEGPEWLPELYSQIETALRALE